MNCISSRYRLSSTELDYTPDLTALSNSITIACDGGFKADESLATSAAVMLDEVHMYGSVTFRTATIREYKATNQVAELNAMILGLRLAIDTVKGTGIQDVKFILDSAYVRDGMMAKWFNIWESNGWFTSEGTVVKNINKWKKIKELYDTLESLVEDPEDIIFIKIKSHINRSPRALKSHERGIKSFKKHNGIDVTKNRLFAFVLLNELADNECNKLKA